MDISQEDRVKRNLQDLLNPATLDQDRVLVKGTQSEEPGITHTHSSNKDAHRQAKQFDTIYNSTRSKDVTIHLDFDIFNDLDEELEEFNRLGRLGDFGTAESFFNQHLKAHVTSPWVFVQYAEMLLVKGDYKSFHQLDPGPIFHRLRTREILDNSDDLAVLELNWRLLNAVALSYSRHELRPIQDELRELRAILPVPENIGSTEVSRTAS